MVEASKRKQDFTIDFRVGEVICKGKTIEFRIEKKQPEACKSL